ncbi:hypothetical protein AXF42_Ash006738 [Apostasia shenzhenica]|uniref:Uncharacterized protein n=1 Tax=Apostasia shenzhenica TaxID=1088818 RepID=A0A2I0AJ90_9ASPA|nr:hypothetical protein AXF42_Ash006738 [Apostasia shenzhenica]
MPNMASSGGRWLLLLLRWLVLLLLLYTSTVTTTVAGQPRPLSPLSIWTLADVAVDQYNFQNRNENTRVRLLLPHCMKILVSFTTPASNEILREDIIPGSFTSSPLIFHHR